MNKIECTYRIHCKCSECTEEQEPDENYYQNSLESYHDGLVRDSEARNIKY